MRKRKVDGNLKMLINIKSNYTYIYFDPNKLLRAGFHRQGSFINIID